MKSFNQKNQPNSVYLYDTTLRDGAQKKGISYSLDDKLRIAKLLDSMGVSYIEGGWPGSNPKDMEFFNQIKKQGLKNSKVVAFGSTRRAGLRANQDMNLVSLVKADTETVAIVGKTSALHVEKVLRTTKEENLAMIKDSVEFCKRFEKEVVFDAEHFFDGYNLDKDYAAKCLETAYQAGADWLVLCDTNGGTLPHHLSNIVSCLNERYSGKLGIHAHNDSELAVANAIAAVEAGVRQVQGTINGYGERCGNTNLISLVPALQVKSDYVCIPDEQVEQLTAISRTVSEIANLNPDPYAPYVGSAAFAHKAGLHASAVNRLTSSYEHLPPQSVGNTREIVVSELAGRGNMKLIASQLNLSETSDSENKILNKVKELEQKGYKFEDAQGSVELMMRRLKSDYNPPFSLVDMFVSSTNKTASSQSKINSEAVVKLNVQGQISHTVADGCGPVHALDSALRRALSPWYPQIKEVSLKDYKVRILDPEKATGATTRVVVVAAKEEERFSCVGCSDNIIEASCEALLDSFELFILKNNLTVNQPQPAGVVA